MPLRFLKAATLLVVLLNLFAVYSANASTTATISDGEELKLIGTGIYKELRNDIYVGALYGPQSVTDVSDLKSDNVAKRMSLRFVSNYSNRKLARHWKERMAMNNPRSQWQPLTKDIVDFSKLFKRSLTYGDEINIDHVPGVGTQIYLNQTLFKTFVKAGFSELLLNVWLGNIPPTKAFKTSIRGQDAAAQSANIAQYASINVAVGRFDDDAQQEITKVATKETTPKKKQVVAKTQPKKTEKKKKVVAEKTKPKETPPTPAKEKPKTDIAEEATSDIAVEEKVAEQKPTPRAEEATSDIVAEEKAAAPTENIAEVITPEPEPQAEPEAEETFFDADLLTGSYTRDLIGKIRQHQKYPRKALISGEEGDVTISVTIDSDGNITNAEIIERSSYRNLNKGAMKIVKKAAPYQAIPKELNLNEFKFEVPISFKL